MSGLLDDYLTRAELAKELRASWRTIARYEDQPNGLPSIMLGGRRMYRRDQVKHWLETQEARRNGRRRLRHRAA